MFKTFESRSGASRIFYLIQFLVTIAMVIFIPDRPLLTGCLILFWVITFYRRGVWSELVFFLAASAIFSASNYGALKAGAFRFHNIDVLLMPWNELVMWGFYCLNSWRMIGGSLRGNRHPVWAIFLAAAFAVSFSLIHDEVYLALALSVVFLVALSFFHSLSDVKYMAYFAFMGFVVESYGLLFDFWSYPRADYFSWPLWGPLMWLNIGWIISQVTVPFLCRAAPKVGK